MEPDNSTGGANMPDIQQADLIAQKLDVKSIFIAPALGKGRFWVALTGQDRREDLASRVLDSSKYSEETKTLAGSMLSQSKKPR